jgi:hypothetical protein
MSAELNKKIRVYDYIYIYKIIDLVEFELDLIKFTQINFLTILI